jgi:hypothetical protein
LVETYIARLRLTPEEVAAYNPRPGVDVLWLEREKPDVMVAQFVGSDLYPQPHLRRTAAQLRTEVLDTFRGRVIDDNLTYHPKTPRRLLKIETILDHPNVSSGVTRELKMAAEGATEVHDVEMTKEEFDEVKYDRESGRYLMPKEVRVKPKQIQERTGEGRIILRDIGKEEKYVVSFGIIDIQ